MSSLRIFHCLKFSVPLGSTGGEERTHADQRNLQRAEKHRSPPGHDRGQCRGPRTA